MTALKLTPKSFRRKKILSFGLFGIFFVYYIASAIIQTKAMQHIASIPLFDLPLGLVLSLGIFPVSWLLLIIFFIWWR